MDRGNEQWLQAHGLLLTDSYRRATGCALLPEAPVDGSEERAPASLEARLNEAPFVLLSHGTEEDPVLNYGNRAALALWETDWETFTSMPSRLTAEPMDREERERLLDEVRRQGYSDAYQGVRISRSGRRFRIERAVIWNLTDADGTYMGQAAMFPGWTPL
ncbi:MEKHLA domain-containing protein [Cohnella sp. REN36]|uniref:MEKHLA domain-containing protein n=1 Tax=Cohnella sp. REN36 TaxID=2887347 RepID=UPI001D13B577|nr:MEKHLA domain-containing protein [Cohnella sp. REN36]MCC3377026.1 MEKHLA domain-containing protein [Cohnella sp. REN36]